MKKQILLGFIAIILSITGAFCQSNNRMEANLENFKKGIYEYVDGPYKGAVITRTEKWQVEEHVDGTKVKFRINWPNDFEYHLRFEKINDYTGQMLYQDKLVTRVLEINDEIYTVMIHSPDGIKTVKIKRVDDDPKNQENFSAVMNRFRG